MSTRISLRAFFGRNIPVNFKAFNFHQEMEISFDVPDGSNLPEVIAARQEWLNRVVKNVLKKEILEAVPLMMTVAGQKLDSVREVELFKMMAEQM